MCGGLERGRGYLPARVANRIMGEPAINGARAAHACAWSDAATETASVSTGSFVPKKVCVCMMEPFLSKSGHDKAAVVEVAINRETWRLEVFSY